MRRILHYPVPLWLILTTVAFGVLAYLTSATGCTSSAIIANQTPNPVQITLGFEGLVVWRGAVGPNDTTFARYRIVRDGALALKADFPNSSIAGKGKGYIMILAPILEVFVVQADRVSAVELDRDMTKLEIVFNLARAASACAVQSVLDLTGAPDPAKLN